MATTEVDVGLHGNTDFDRSRRLSVADTLAQATKALQTHRAWMKRRISTTVAPGPTDEGETGNRDHQVNDIFVRDSVKDEVSLEDLLESGPFEVPNREVIHSAPPPFSDAPNSTISLQRKRHLANKASPSSLRDLPDLPEENHALTGVHSLHSSFYGTSSVADHTTSPHSSGEYQQNSIGSRKDNDSSSKVFTGDGSQNEISMPQTQTSRKKYISSKQRISPAMRGDDLAENEVTSPTSPKDVFYGGSLNPRSLPTHLSPPVVSSNAWGSVESLESHEVTYRESTSETEVGRTGHTPTFANHHSRETNLSSSSHSAVKEQLTTKSSLEEMEDKSQTDSLKISLAEQRSVKEKSRTVTVEYLDNSLEHTVDDQTDNYESPSNHLESLQADSSIKILPVSPAPRDQRGSYSKHTKSKVSAAEESLEIIDREPGVKLHMGMDQPLSLRLPVTPNHQGRQVDAGRVSEAIIQPVLPKQRERKVGPVLVTRHKLKTSPTTPNPPLVSSPLVSVNQESVVQGGQENLEYLDASVFSPKSEGEISPRVNVKETAKLPTVTSTIPTRVNDSESFSKDREITPSSPVIVAKGGSLSEVRTAWSEKAVKSEQKKEPEEALRELSLPPLKEHNVQEMSIGECIDHDIIVHAFI